MKSITFGQYTISEDSPTLIIAEIADSHNGSVETAKKMIDEIKKAGVHVAKFQLHLPDIEMVPGSINMWDGPLYDILKRNLFTREMHKEVMDYCEEVGVEYLCTPFCPAAVDVLQELGVKAFKTGSGELTNLPMQRKLAKISAETGKPVIVSTGMSKWEEIVETVAVYEEEGAKDNLILTNCTSEYPPGDYSHINLGRIRKMQEEFGVWAGQSDHTVDNYTAYASIPMGAKVIEKHFTLSRDQDGPDHKIALEPDMLADLAEGVRKIDVSLGSEKNITKDEQVVRDWAYHSVVAAEDIAAGTMLTLDMLIPKRPGSGIPAKFLDIRYADKLIGKRVTKDFPKDTILQWEYITV